MNCRYANLVLAGFMLLPALSGAAEDSAEPGLSGERAPVRYRPVRDPFRPFILEYGEKVPEQATPLQRYQLSQLKVAAVIVGLEQPAAMVEDANGMGYVVTPGTPIGTQGGVVTEILPDGIVVEEKTRDFYDRVQVVRRILRIPGEQEQTETLAPETVISEGDEPPAGAAPTEAALEKPAEGEWPGADSEPSDVPLQE